MIVDINIKNCKHLKEISYYNSNYYELPFVVNGCNVVHEKYGGDETLDYYSLGNVVEGKYEEQYFLNDDLLDRWGCADEFTFNSDKLSTENEYI